MRFIIDTGTKIIEESVSYPLLLWDPLAIEKLHNKMIIRQLFGINTLISYDNVDITWDGVSWPPSMDSLIFANTLSRIGYKKKNLTQL
jgi:hypothetical protein